MNYPCAVGYFMQLHQRGTSESNLVLGIAEHIVSSFLEEKGGKIPQSLK